MEDQVAMTDEEVEEVMEFMDTNQDGVLDLEDFMLVLREFIDYEENQTKKRGM